MEVNGDIESSSDGIKIFPGDFFFLLFLNQLKDQSEKPTAESFL